MAYLSAKSEYKTEAMEKPLLAIHGTFETPTNAVACRHITSGAFLMNSAGLPLFESMAQASRVLSAWLNKQNRFKNQEGKTGFRVYSEPNYTYEPDGPMKREDFEFLFFKFQSPRRIPSGEHPFDIDHEIKNAPDAVSRWPSLSC